MYKLKTQQRDVSVTKFLNAVENKQRREDAFAVLELMKKITKEPAKMWGPTIVGFGRYHYKYESGHEGDMPVAAFSPRKPALVLYTLCGSDKGLELMKKLGKYKSSKACLYVKKLDDIDLKVLEQLIKESIKEVKKRYPDK